MRWAPPSRPVGAADQVEYENIGGKGGTIGLAKYAEKYGSDANTLLMGGMVMVGRRGPAKPAVDMGHIQPLARLTSDYLIAAVPAASSIKTGKDLANAMRTDLAALPVAGGSAGAWTTSTPACWPARPRPSPRRWCTALCQRARGGGFAAQRRRSRGPVGLQRIQRRAGLGQAAGRGRIGPAQCLWHPRLQDQGIDAVMANWRGVFTGKDVSPARTAELLAAVEQATHHESWLQTLKQNRWEASWLSGGT